MKIHPLFIGIYGLCIFLLYPLVARFAGGTSHFWFVVQVGISGPGLIYLGLVLQRVQKPVSLARKISGIIIFLTGFAWLFSILFGMTRDI